MKHRQVNHRRGWLACIAIVLVAVPVAVAAADVTAKPTAADLDKLFPSFADGHTAGLWLFDEPQYLNMTLTDAGREMYDLRLLPGGRLEPGRFGNGLTCSAHAGPAGRESWRAAEYDGLLPDARPVAPPEHLLAALAGKAWTCEFWLKPGDRPKSEAVVFEVGTGDALLLRCALDPQAGAFVLRGAAVGDGFTCPTDVARVSDGAWHHVAFVCDDRRARHYLDGRAQPALTAKAAPAEPAADIPGLIGVVSRAAIENGVVSRRDTVNVKVMNATDSFWGDTNDLAWVERWRGRIALAALPGDQGEPIEFFAESAGGARLAIDGHAVIAGLSGAAAREGEIRPATAGPLPLELEWHVRSRAQRGRLLWRRPGQGWAVVPGAALSHTRDDQAAARGEAKEVLDGRFYFTLGAGRFYEQPFDGMLDELRFSDVARYGRDEFTPASFSRNHGANPPAPARPTGPPLLFEGNADGDVLPIGSRKHVFIDDVLVEARQGVHLVSHPPSLRPDDVSGVADVPMSSYDRDGQTIQFIGTGRPPTRPGSTNWDGRMFDDPTVPRGAEDRFKYAGRDVQRGIYLFVSPDGVHWRRNETIMLPFDPDGGNEIFWDDQRGLYATFMRAGGQWRPPFGRAAALGQTREIFKPWPFRPQAEPFLFAKAWTLPSIAGELPTPFEPYPQIGHGGLATEGHVYRTRAIKYPWAPDTYVAFVWRLFYPPHGGDEIRATELATSRDGVHWRLFGKPFFYDIGWELEPGFRVTEALSADALVRRGDELWTYASLREDTHRGTGGRSRIVRYVQRLDGFTSLQARDKPGWLWTRPFTFSGDRLELNVAARGFVRVGLLDEAGNEIPGFTPQDCDPIQADAMRHTVSWRGSADVSRLAGRPVRLRMELQDSDLFAFQFVPGM
jgi:hypothetical protein